MNWISRRWTPRSGRSRESLPQPADLAQERQWSVTERGQMATALAVRDRRHAISLLLKTAVVAIVAISALTLAELTCA